MITVNLMPLDIKRCREAAKRRVVERDRAGAVSDFDFAMKCHYSGVLGEYAVCKAYDCEWLGEYFEGSDWDNRTWDTALGEVRATLRPDLEDGMRLYPNDDRLEAPYIWVALRQLQANIVKATIVGWFKHKDGRKDEWWHADIGNYGAWVVPRNCLKPMSKL